MEIANLHTFFSSFLLFLDENSELLHYDSTHNRSLRGFEWEKSCRSPSSSFFSLGKKEESPRQQGQAKSADI
jgi:hypothetical protein